MWISVYIYTLKTQKTTVYQWVPMQTENGHNASVLQGDTAKSLTIGIASWVSFLNS